MIDGYYVQQLALKGNYMNNPEEELKLQLRPRPKETVSLEIPKDTLESLKKVACQPRYVLRSSTQVVYWAEFAARFSKIIF
jgi:hypothetical protein